MAEGHSSRIFQERELLSEQVTEVKKIALDWMNEAIGYREKYEAGLKKIKIFEIHIDRMKEEFEQRNEQIKSEYDILKE